MKLSRKLSVSTVKNVEIKTINMLFSKNDTTMLAISYQHGELCIDSRDVYLSRSVG